MSGFEPTCNCTLQVHIIAHSPTQYLVPKELPINLPVCSIHLSGMGLAVGDHAMCPGTGAVMHTDLEHRNNVSGAIL